MPCGRRKRSDDATKRTRDARPYEGNGCLAAQGPMPTSARAAQRPLVEGAVVYIRPPANRNRIRAAIQAAPYGGIAALLRSANAL